jgi:hypothetical protein
MKGTLAGLLMIGLGITAPAQNAEVAIGFVIGEATLQTSASGTIVTVPVLTGGRQRLVNTEAVTADAAASIQRSVTPRSLVDYRVRHGDVVVEAEPAATFHKALTKGDNPVFDTMMYGPELAARDGRPGDLVAAGWVYGKGRDEITIGDGRLVTQDIAGRRLPHPVKRYEETYRVAGDAEVYEVSTADLSVSHPSSFDRIPVTRDYAYSTVERHAAFVVFDRDYRHADAAKVRAIYYFTPHDTSDGLPVWDVPTQSALLKDKGVDPASGRPYVDILATGVTQAPYTRSTEPFEIVKDTLYYVGDNEVALYLLHAGDRLILVDAGWPGSGYQYWTNIERMGFDPRKITDVLISHGHGDHYGTAGELLTMIENAGGQVTLRASREDVDGIQQDALGNAWTIPPAIPASESWMRTRYTPYVYDQFLEFGNVRIKPITTPGHTVGTTSFVFDVADPAHPGHRITFGFMGGYGFNGLERPTTANAFRRLSFPLGLSWLQQRVDVDYVSPSHTNQYPIVEVYQALKAYGEFANFNEKRYEVISYAKSDTQPGYQSIETYGPFKPGRENGEHDVAVTLLDGGKVIRGFDKYMNVNPKIPLLKDGIVIDRDSYVHDPDGYYVQVYADVHDAYNGYLPGSGPVESYRATSGTPEILRTQRLGSRAEAETILAGLQAGSAYQVDFTRASTIVVPPDRPAFRPTNS